MQVTGITYVTINGVLLPTKEGSVSFNTGGKNRTSVPTSTKIGYSEKRQQSSLEFTLAHDSGTQAYIEMLKNSTDAVVNVETDTGTVYIVPQMWCMESPSLSGGEGDMSFSFEGVPAVGGGILPTV